VTERSGDRAKTKRPGLARGPLCYNEPIDQTGAKLLFDDTSTEAERVLIEGLRSRSGAQRFAIARALTARTITLALRALRRAHPELSEREVRYLCVEIHHGRELTEMCRRQDGQEAAP
jgi:hypothetical protein